MKNHPVILAVALAVFGGALPAPAQTTAFTYQGYLETDGLPAQGAYDLRLGLHTASQGGLLLGPILTNSAVNVSNGLFMTWLDFGPGVLAGNLPWLEIAVRPSGQGAFVILSPRQPIAPVPRALHAVGANSAASAAQAPWEGLSNVPPGFADGIDNDTLYTAGPGLILNYTNFYVAYGGNGSADTLSRSDHSHEGGPGNAWLLSGNAGTSPGANFLGTTDQHALEFKVDNDRALRLEPTGSDPHVIGGGMGNQVGGSLAGVTIAGGGANVVQANRATIGGGLNNQISAAGDSAMIPGGQGALASHYGQLTHASGIFGQLGDAQSSVYVLRNSTASATLTELFLDGGSQRLLIPLGGKWAFEVMVVAASLNGSTAGFQARGVIKNVNGTTRFGGNQLIPIDTFNSDVGINWSVTVEADNVRDALVIKVKGLAGTLIRWVATVRTTELIY